MPRVRITTLVSVEGEPTLVSDETFTDEQTAQLTAAGHVDGMTPTAAHAIRNWLVGMMEMGLEDAVSLYDEQGRLR